MSESKLIQKYAIRIGTAPVPLGNFVILSLAHSFLANHFRARILAVFASGTISVLQKHVISSKACHDFFQAEAVITHILKS